MAFPTAVNDQITDSVTQSNLSVVGESPAVALSTLYQVSAQAVGIKTQSRPSSRPPSRRRLRPRKVSGCSIPSAQRRNSSRRQAPVANPRSRDAGFARLSPRLPVCRTPPTAYAPSKVWS